MSDIAIKIENLSKQYRLGVVGTQTLRGDLQRFWWKIRGKGDPTLKIGEENKLSDKGGEYVWALKDINLEIKEGEVLGIIGKNGAGKSTLLKILSRVTGPTTGTVKVKGRLASLLEVGTGFHPELTGRENIYLNGAILGMTKAEINKQFDAIVDFAGIAKYIDTPVKRYSSGMYVRLGFAVAAHLNSEILVVDEVLAVGDAEFQKKAIGKMQDVSKGQGKTVLFVSHNMASVKNLCNRGILLENGKTKLISTVDEVISAYSTLTANSDCEVFFNKNTKRKGNGNIQFDWIRISDEKGNKKNEFSIGDNVKFEFAISNYSSEKKSELAIQIKTAEGMPVFHIMARDSNFIIEHNSKKEIYSILLSDIRLYPGIYSVNITCANTTGHEVFDQIDEVLTLTIKDGGDYTSRNLPRAAGLFFLTPQWKKH